MYDVKKVANRPDPALIKAFSETGESASIYEIMKKNAMDCDIRPVWPGVRMCGSALTVKTRPGDNLMLHKAIDMVQPGDVIVLDCGGYLEAGGMFGGLMAASLKVKGCAGLITNGSVRDTMVFKEIGLPVYSRGISVKYTTKTLGGTINHPVLVGGVTVNPGDIVFADNDGIVVIPPEMASSVLEETKKREVREDAMMQKILAGEGTTYDFLYKNAYEALNLSEEE